MPKRSNEFQRLVALIQRALAPTGATVTESASIQHQGHNREIDVLVESDLGMYKLKIAVEAKDHAKKLGPQQIEEYIGKYREGDGIKVNQVVVISSKGFTRAAKDKARAAGIILLTLAEATAADWRKYIRPGTTQPLKVGIQPHLHKISFEPPLNIDIKTAMQQGVVRCNCCGRLNGRLPRFVSERIERRFRSDPSIREKLRKEMAARGGGVLLTMPFCAHGKTLILPDAQFPLGVIKPTIHFYETEGRLNFELYEQIDQDGNRQTVQRAHAKIGAKKFDFVFPDGLKSKQIVLNVSDDDCCAAKK